MCTSSFVVNLVFDRLFVTIKTLMITCKKYQPSKPSRKTWLSYILQPNQPTQRREEKDKKECCNTPPSPPLIMPQPLQLAGLWNIYLPNTGSQKYTFYQNHILKISVLDKIHNFKIYFFAKVTVFKISYSTKFTFLEPPYFSLNSHFSKNSNSMELIDQSKFLLQVC